MIVLVSVVCFFLLFQAAVWRERAKAGCNIFIPTSKQWKVDDYSGFIQKPVYKKEEQRVSPLESLWFIQDWGIPDPSPAEERIITELNKYDVVWYREVSFKGLVNSRGANYRFDFWLEDHNTIIEYDGKDWHQSEQSRIDDNIKSEFCKQNGIRLVRLNKKHYYRMEEKIKELLM